MYFRECPFCHSNLDPGERCDCEDKREEKEKKILASLPEMKIEEGGQYKWLDMVS